MRKILLVFKTHLDLGFTDLAETVRQRYLTQFIPQALALARKTRNTDHRFVWTIGSWLLEEYRRSVPCPAELDEAVAQGDIRWHALPFTTHTEYMTPELFQYGLSISKCLDQRYGMTTKAAKMTDVPGHTVAMVPLLAEAGVRFLHIGVNPASTVPDVPDLFWWQAPTGDRVLVMYNGSYGEMTPIGDSGAAVYFAHTGDNNGPQSAAQIAALYQSLRSRYPGAEIVAATLEDVAELALAQEGLPTLSGEIGDSWIHGTGTDPQKTSQFRSLLRVPQSEQIYTALLPVPEHTWGLDEKTHLPENYWKDFRGEHRFFVRQEFEKARATPRFQRMEQSWQEQRDYMKGLPGAEEASRNRTDLTGFQEVPVGSILDIGGFSLAVDATGALVQLTHEGSAWADDNHPLGRFFYEVFSQREYDRWRAQYMTSQEDWAIEDFGKLGVEQANDRLRQYVPAVTGLFRQGNTLVICSAFPKEAVERFGAPAFLETRLTCLQEKLQVDAAWFQKAASRIPEAIWMDFSPRAKLQAIHKLGLWLNPFDVVAGGNRRMHHTQKGVRWEGLELEGLDTGLVSLGGPTLLEFDRTLPDQSAGAWWNLYNNVWGTNFPMWYDQDARFRFILDFAQFSEH